MPARASSRSSSTSVPWGWKASSAIPTGSSRSITRAPLAERTLRASAWAQTAPKRPVEAPTTATGLLRSGDSASGRESQSRAFLSWPGIEWLYSGVETRTASASAIASKSAWTGSGRACSSSSSNGGISLSPSNSTSSASPGSRSPAARRSLELWEPARRLPERPRTFIGLCLGQLEVDEQLDLVCEREAALGQRSVPVEAVLGAVDDRLELEADLLDVAEGHGRLGDRPAGLDRAAAALDRQLAVDDQCVALGADQRRGEGHVRVALGVEEVRRLQMGGQVLVLDRDRVRGHAALEAQGAVLVGGEGGVEVLKTAPEGRDDHVLDGEAHVGVDLVHGPRGAGGNRGGGADGGHRGCFLLARIRTVVRLMSVL